MDELQLDEQNKQINQVNDRVNPDTFGSRDNPKGFTPNKNPQYKTPVEEVGSGQVPEVEATADISVGELVSNYIAGRNEIESPAKFSSGVSNVSEIPLSILQTSSVYFVDTTQRTVQDDNDTLLTRNDSDPTPEPPVDPPVDPPEPPVDPPVDPPEPPVDPPEPPVDPPEPPVDPPVDPPEPPVDPPVDPPEPPVDPPVDPPEPPVDPPVDPPEPDGGGNPGNDKDVGNSPWDGETGASDNPGKGNHQDGQDPEPNQPPGDSKNDGSNGNQNPPSEDDKGNGKGNGGPKGNNGWGNGDDDAPGNSLDNNNAENDQTPSENYDELVSKFLDENPSDPQEYTTEYSHEENLQDDNYFDTHNDFPLDVPEINDYNVSYDDNFDADFFDVL